MQNITTKLDEETIKKIDEFAQNNYFQSDSELIRQAILSHLKRMLSNQENLLTKPPEDPRRRSFVPLKQVSLQIPDEFIDGIEKLRARNYVLNRSDFIRDAVNAFFSELNDLQNLLGTYTFPAPKSVEKSIKRKQEIGKNSVTINGSEYKTQSIQQYLENRRIIAQNN